MSRYGEVSTGCEQANSSAAHPLSRLHAIRFAGGKLAERLTKAKPDYPVVTRVIDASNATGAFQYGAAAVEAIQQQKDAEPEITRGILEGQEVSSMIKEIDNGEDF